MSAPRNYVVMETSYISTAGLLPSFKGDIVRLVPEAAQHYIDRGQLRQARKKDYEALEEINKQSDTLIAKMYEAHQAFKKKFFINADVLYIGQNQLITIMQSRNWIRLELGELDRPVRFCGFPCVRVDAYDHLSFGLTVDGLLHGK